jgi:hypothetical protein
MSSSYKIASYTFLKVALQSLLIPHIYMNIDFKGDQSVTRWEMITHKFQTLTSSPDCSPIPMKVLPVDWHSGIP